MILMVCLILFVLVLGLVFAILLTNPFAAYFVWYSRLMFAFLLLCFMIVLFVVFIVVCFGVFADFVWCFIALDLLLLGFDWLD